MTSYDPLAQCALLANSAGIGGGPFYVPLLNVVLGFDLKAATALSHTIVGEGTVIASQACMCVCHTCSDHAPRRCAFTRYYVP